MVQKIGRFFSQGFSSPEAGAFAYSCVTLLVTLVGIVRERILASTIGPGPVLDAYVLAHKIPDVLYVTTAALFVATTLLPYIVREQSPEKKQRFLSEIYTVQSIGSIVLALILIVLAPVIIPLLAPGFAPATLAMAIDMSRIILISPIFLGISNILGLSAHMHKQFIVVALSPLIYNLGMVVSVWFGYEALGYWVLPLGIVVAALMHMLVQLIATRSLGMALPQWVAGVDWRRIKSILLNALPRAFALATVPLTALGIIALGSTLPEGSVSLLNFAIIIQNVPVTLIGSSMAVASFPVLVDLAAKGDVVGFSRRVAASVRVMTTIAFPVIAVAWVLRDEVVQMLLSSGRFTAEHGQATAVLVGILVLGVWAQSIMQLGARVYYAHERTWNSFFQNSIGMVVSLGVAYAAGQIWGMSLVLLASAFVIGWWVNALIVAVRIGTRYIEQPDIFSIGISIVQSCVAAFAGVCVGLWAQNLTSSLVLSHVFITAIVQAVLVGGSMSVVMVLVLLMMGNTEIRQLWNTLRRRLARKVHHK